MNNTTYELVANTLKFYNKIYDEYNKDIIFGEITTINKKELKLDMPQNLKTLAKLKLFETFGENITQEHFIQLLMLQTTGADFLNLTYIFKYYNLSYDTNGMPIFNQYCAYTDFLSEALHNWYIWNTLTQHNMFSKYMNKQLQFTLQTRIEDSIFPKVENFKQDLHFTHVNIIAECNEGHHELEEQKILDTQKIALNKMNGNVLISMYTNSLVNVKLVTATIYNNLYNDDAVLEILLEKIYTQYSITIEEREIVKTRFTTLIRKYFKIKYILQSQKKNVNKFNKLTNAQQILFTMNVVLKEYLQIINETIHAKVLNNNYVKCYTSTLLDMLTSSLLNDFAFRQDYIKVILVENLVDAMQGDVVYLAYVQTLKDKPQYAELNINIIEAYNYNKIIEKKFTNDSSDFVRLFELKLASLQNIDITFDQVTSLLKVEDTITFRNIVNEICKIYFHIKNENIRITWKQLQKIIFSHDSKIKMVLALYYTEVDAIYENIITRIQQHANRLVCTPCDYNNYMSRIYTKCNAIINTHITVMKTLLIHTTGLNNLINKLTGTTLHNDIVVPINTLIQSVFTEIDIVGFTHITADDLEKISRKNIIMRVQKIDSEFTSICEPEIIMIQVSDVVDEDEVD